MAREILLSCNQTLNSLAATKSSSPSVTPSIATSAAATNTNKGTASSPATTRIPAITDPPNYPLTPLTQPERGSLSRPSPQQPPPSSPSNPALIRARLNLLTYLPGRKDHVLRSLVSMTGQLKHPHWAQPPRSHHFASHRPEAFFRYRNHKFAFWRKRTGYAAVGGGLVGGNMPLLTLRKNQVKKMWVECVELAQLEEAELLEEERWENGGGAWGMWARVKRKARGVGRVLGQDMRERPWEKVVVVQKVGGW